MHKQKGKRLRLLPAGRSIVDGPRSIFSPPEIDPGLGWLSPDLVLRHSATIDGIGNAAYESVALYSEWACNREPPQLFPVIRTAYWDLTRDQGANLTWPSVEISLGKYDKHLEEVSCYYREIQDALGKIEAVDRGLPSETRNNPPREGVLLDKGHIHIECNNWSQSFVYSSDAGRDSITDLFFQGISLLKGCMAPISRDGWVERYSYDLSKGHLEHWGWTGVPPND